MLWFAEKFVSLLIEQHRDNVREIRAYGCDLLKNSYLCLLNNTEEAKAKAEQAVVICWKIRIFAYWTTPDDDGTLLPAVLWFAEKFVSLLIEQHLRMAALPVTIRCDLLKNSYLCLLNNTRKAHLRLSQSVVICWKIRIFAYWTTPEKKQGNNGISCDLLKNSYLCLLNNTPHINPAPRRAVVICWKIRIFAYWTTPP